MNRILWRSLLVGWLALVSSASMALDEMKPPGATWQAEQSSEVLRAQQAYQGRVNASGGIPMDTEPSEASSRISADQKAAATLTRAAVQQRAKQNLIQAEARTEGKSGRNWTPWWVAAVMLALGTFGTVSLKNWFARNAPAMPVTRKRRRSDRINRML